MFPVFLFMSNIKLVKTILYGANRMYFEILHEIPCQHRF